MVPPVFKNIPLTRFLEEIGSLKLDWLVKRLSGNDTGLTGGHQSGLYLPREFVESAFPEITTTETHNPSIVIEDGYFPSCDHSVPAPGLRAIYYNGRFFGGTRNEFRLTRWGGRSSPMQDVENTGSICLLAVGRREGKPYCLVWIASNSEEEKTIEDWLGFEVEPGEVRTNCAEERKPDGRIEIPEIWKTSFPSGSEIFEFVCRIVPSSNWAKSLDELLLKRRRVEYEVFSRIEEDYIMAVARSGFRNAVEFIDFANSVLNRRKSRSGRSLELSLAEIFKISDLCFETQVVTENRKRPDFVFPSGTAYHDERFPTEILEMMAVKTCCKDRWRQVINEADRIARKHLFTLQEGISENQLREMRTHNVFLVIPEPHRKSFSENSRDELMSLEQFVRMVAEEQRSFPDIKNWTRTRE